MNVPEHTLPFNEQIVIWGYATSGRFRPLDWAWEQRIGRTTPAGTPLWDFDADHIVHVAAIDSYSVSRSPEKWCLPYVCGPHDLVHAGGARL